MRRLRVAYLVAAIVLVVVLPIGEASVLLVLFVAVTLAAAALMLRSAAEPPSRVVAVGNDPATLALQRRIVPELRMHRPVATIEAQGRWRAAGAARRQFRVVS